jgi:hypothetical protein
MGRGVLKELLGGLDEAVKKIPDKRKANNALTYSIADAVKSAFAVFYFQHPSLLKRRIIE